MKPFTAVLGILLGSLVSITVSLGGVLLVFWILRAESPRYGAEMPELLRSTGIFFVLAALAAGGFVGMLRKARWRLACLGLLWAGLIGTGWYYWPA